MSELTCKLLGAKRVRSTARWHAILTDITRELVELHGTPTLGNLADPTSELFYIALSAKTSEISYLAAYKRLHHTYPTLESIANARLDRIRRCVAVAGLGNKRAKQLKGIAGRLVGDFGQSPNRKLKKLDAAAAYRYLVSLPGIGPKSALCVLMYSLRFDVFPVDTHVRRILARMGLIPPTMRQREAQMRIPQLIPNGISKALHVALVVHGRTVCRSRSPECGLCPVARYCKTGRTLQNGR